MQEKQEQEKRQREQHAMLQRTGAIRPDGMMGPRPPGPGMVGMPPGMHHMEGQIRYVPWILIFEYVLVLLK